METKIAKPNLDANVQRLFDEEVFLTGIPEYGTKGICAWRA